MKDWFLALAPRERVIVASGAVALLLLFVYLALWEPLDRRVQGLREGVAAQQGNLAWMLGASEEIRRLRGTGGRPSTADDRSLLTIVDQSARESGIKQALHRMEPEGGTGVRLWLAATPFDQLVTWLGQLEREHGIAVSALSLEPKETPGTVEARVTLERGGA